jgi:hypothetical protein
MQIMRRRLSVWVRKSVQAGVLSSSLLAGLLACVVCVLGVLVCASSAFAARGHEFEKAFGERCLAKPCIGGSLKEPDGVAVNETSGDI